MEPFINKIWNYIVPVKNEEPESSDSEDEQDYNKCCICLEDEDINNKPKIELECGHVLHTRCGLGWLNIHKSCPLCRKEVKIGNEEQVGPVGPRGVIEHSGGSPRGLRVAVGIQGYEGYIDSVGLVGPVGYTGAALGPIDPRPLVPLGRRGFMGPINNQNANSTSLLVVDLTGPV